MFEQIDDWQAYLDGTRGEKMAQSIQRHIHRHGRSGLPLGSNNFIKELETTLNRSLKRKKVGRPKKLD